MEILTIYTADSSQKSLGKKWVKIILNRLPFFLTIMVVLFFSLFNLENDPSPMKTLDDLLDEFAWASNAREKYLFGEYLHFPDQSGYGLFGAPLFTLLIYLFFIFFGIKLSTLRLVSLVFFWGTLIFVYKIFKTQYTSYQSLIPVFLLGLNHQALIYARWSTPIFLEIFLLSVTFYYFTLLNQYDLKHEDRKKYWLLAGLALGTTITAKLSAIFMIDVFSLYFIIYFVWVKKIPISRTGTFWFGLLIPGVFLGCFMLSYSKPFLALIYCLENRGALSAIYGWRDILNSVVFNPAFMNPMLIIAILGSSGLFLMKIFLNLKSFDFIEKLAFFWIFVGVCLIAVWKQTYYRRYILFIVPIVILFAKYCILLLSDSYRRFSVWSPKDWGYFASVVLIVVLSFLLFPMAHEKFRFSWFSSKSFILIQNSSPYVWAAVFSIAILFIYMFCSSKVLSIFLLKMAIISNVALSGLWYYHSSFTVRDESKKLKDLLAKDPAGLVAFGYLPWMVFFETGTLPVWYMPRYFVDMNLHLPHYLKNHVKEFYISNEVISGTQLSVKDANLVDQKMFPEFVSTPVATLKMIPKLDFSLNKNEYGIVVQILRMDRNSR